MFSEIALKIFCAIKQGIIKSNAQFFKEFFSEDKINSIKLDYSEEKLFLEQHNWSLVCTFDNNFPEINLKLKNSERPFLFAYKGDISLLQNKNNIAIVGTVDPTKEIISREKNIVKEFINNGFCVVSGLAKGCDTIAHQTAVNYSGKTIAFLPTTLNDIYPKENKTLAEKIVEKGGLIITEYVIPPSNKYENIKRFIERDRLQAIFSKAVILIASNSKGNGDSGSRHAMNKAKEYGKKQFIMFSEQDKNNSLFQLNEDYLSLGARVLTKQTIKEL